MSRWRRQQRKRSRPARLAAREVYDFTVRQAAQRRAETIEAGRIASKFAAWKDAHPVQAKRLLKQHGGDPIKAMLSWANA